MNTIYAFISSCRVNNFLISSGRDSAFINFRLIDSLLILDSYSLSSFRKHYLHIFSLTGSRFTKFKSMIIKMKKIRSTAFVLLTFLLSGYSFGQTNDYGLNKTLINSDELSKWTFVGEGKAEKSGSQIAMQESDNSKGVMLVSPESYSSDVVVRYKTLALSSATVLVALVSLSDPGDSENISIPDNFDGSLGLFTNEKENYFFAFKNAPHNVTPFVRKSPATGETIASADKNSMIAGVYYDVEIGKVQGKLWLAVDGVKLFETEDATPLAGGHLALRIRGTAGFKAACLIKDLEIFTRN